MVLLIEMSKLNQILLPLSVIIAFTPLLYYSPYLTVTFVLFSVLIYLYIDYENSLTSRGHLDINALARLVSCVKDFHFTQIIPTSLREYRITNPFAKAYYQSLDMPSVGPQQNTRQEKANGGYVVSPNLVRSENRLFSPSYTTTRQRPRYQIPNGDSFHALSPIQSELYRNSSFSNSEQLKNMSISETSKQNFLRSSMHSDGHNASYTMNSSRNSSGSAKQTPGSAARKVNSFTTPLLASTRYNLSTDSVLFADMNSPGLCSRVAQYNNSSSSASPAVTHQAQYSSPGQFPMVYLGKTTKLPVLSKRNTQKLCKPPVRVRMAPLESEERRSYTLSDRSKILSDYSQTPPKSVLDTLHEISRKRLHAQLGDYEAETTKKQRINDATPSNEAQKRDREETPLDDDDSRITKRTRNNEISSSLSSSVLMHRPNKRKTTAGAEEAPNVHARESTGKVAKKSLPSPEVLPISATVLLDDEEDEPMPVTVQPPQSHQSRKEMILGDSAWTLSGGGDQIVPSNLAPEHWLQRSLVPGSAMALDQLRSFKQKTAKCRLLGMMNTIGKDNKDVDLALPASTQPSASTSSSASTLPTFMLTPTTAVLPTMFQTASDSKAKKQVHFNDNLQIKTFDTSDITSSETSLTQANAVSVTTSVTTLPSIGSAGDSTSSFGDVTSSQPSLGFFPLVTDSNVATTTSTVTPISSVIVPSQTSENTASLYSQKSPSLSLTFGQSTTTAASVSLSPGTFGSVSLNSPTIGATPAISAPTFGNSTAPIPTLGASSTMVSTFGSPATLAPTFGATTPSLPTLGVTAASLSSFGATTTSVPTFGASITSVPTFGASTTSAPTFGASTTSVPTFGTSTTTLPTFGVTATSLPTFGATATSVPTFGATTTSVPTFGTTMTTSMPTFGSTTTPVPTFGATTIQAPTFGSPAPSTTTEQPRTVTFNSATTSLSTFGTAPLAFGSSASEPSSGSAATGVPTFGSSTTSTFEMKSTNFATAVTSTPVFGASMTTAPVFGASSVPSFGTPSSAMNSSAGFGTTTPSSFGSIAPPPAYPGSKPQDGDSSGAGGKPFTFGSQGASVGNFTSPQQSSFAAKPFSFSGAASGDVGSVFGAKPNQNASANPTSPFQFNAGNSMNQNSATDGQPKSGGFKFDKTTAATPFGMFSNSQPTVGNSSATPALGGFSFNSAAKPFGSTTSSQGAQSSFNQNSFGSQNSIPQKSSAVFGFGSTQPASSTFSFNAPIAAPKPAQPTFGSSAGGFGFSSAAAPTFGQPSGPAFQFGAASAANASGGFSFGAAPNTVATPSFGSAAQNAPYQMGAQQFGNAMPPPVAGMFSIGTGSSGSRGRTGARPRSRR